MKNNHGFAASERYTEDTIISTSSILDEAAKFLQSDRFEQEPVSKQLPHKDVLTNLICAIPRIDFLSLIMPEAMNLKKELVAIDEAFTAKDTALCTQLDEPTGKNHASRSLEIHAMLEQLRKRVKQKHYVVCIITQLLTIATDRNWNLCKCYDYVYIYNKAFWKQLSKDDLKHFLGEVAVKFGYPLIEAAHHAFKDELLKQFITQAHLPAPEVELSKIQINLQNGTLEFKDGHYNLKPFDAANFLTYQLPFEYTPGAQCPKFTGYLNKVLPDSDSQRILQEFCGFIFTNLNLEKCLVLTGGGSNGKSVFFNILTAMVGKENTLNYPLGSFSHEYNRAKLTDVLLNYSSEKGDDLHPETFKALISGEPLQAREPYGKPFTIHNKVKFIMNCNELPRITESTEAYFRRYIIIPFDVKISDADKDINLAASIIQNEMPGFLNWVLIGLRRLMDQGEFSKCDKVDNAVSTFKSQSDSVALFIHDLGYKPSINTKKLLADLYHEYKNYCIDDNYKPLGKNKFSQRLINRGFVAVRSNNGSAAFFIEQ